MATSSLDSGACDVARDDPERASEHARRRVVEMFDKPSGALMVALRDFVFRHEIFVEAREFDDGFIFTQGFPKDPDAATALFGYVRSESRLLLKLLGESTYKELLRLVRSHRRTPRARAANRRPKTGRQGRRS